LAGLVLALAGAAGAAGGVTGAVAVLTGLRLGAAEAALLRGAFTGILETGAAFLAGLAEGFAAAFTADLAECAVLSALVFVAAGEDKLFTVSQLLKINDAYSLYR